MADPRLETVLLLEQSCLTIDRATADASERAAAEETLTQFKLSPQPYDVSLLLLERGDSSQAQLQALAAIKAAALREWGTESLPSERARELAYELYSRACGACEAMQPFVMMSLARCIAVLFKRGWPAVGLAAAAAGAGPGPSQGMDETEGDAAQSEAESAALAAFAAQQAEDVLAMVRPCLAAPSLRAQELGLILADGFRSEFSAGESSRIEVAWEFHVRCHKLFEAHTLRPLFEAALQSLQAQASAIVAARSLQELDLVMAPGVRAVELAHSLLSWEFDEETSADALLTRSIVTSGGAAATEAAASAASPSVAAAGQSLGTLGSGHAAVVEASLVAQTLRPGPAWADVLVKSPLPALIVELYLAANAGVAVDTVSAAANGSLLAVAAAASASVNGAGAGAGTSGAPAPAVRPRLRRERKIVMRFTKALLKLLGQLASLRGRVFDPPGVREAAAAAAAARDVAMSAAGAGVGAGTNGGASRAMDTAADIVRHMEAAARAAGQGALGAQFRARLLQAVGAIGAVVYAEFAAARPPQQEEGKGAGAWGQATMGATPGTGLGAGGAAGGVGGGDLMDCTANDISGVCSALERAAKHFPIEDVLAGIADGTSLPAQLLQWTRAVLTPAVFTRFGADAIDTWGVEAFDQLLDAWTALVGATESPALSPGEAAAALAALAEPTQEVVETYVGLRLAQAADEAVRGENDVAERFHGGGDGAAGSAFGDFLESLARLGRVCPERCLKAVGDAIAERVQRLRGLAESAAAAGCADGEELEQQALVCHEGLAWLFEFLSHVLCDVGAQQGETPLIPTAMVAASRRHCEAVAAGIGADLRGVGAALNAALRQRQATMGPAALDGIEATGEGQAAVAAAQAVGEAAAPSDPVVSALAGVLAYAEFENQVLTASVRAEPRMGGGRGMSLEVGGMGGGAGATSPGSTSSSIEFHTDKPPLVSPYVGAALLRLLSRWAGTYLAPNQLHYTSLLGGDLVGAIDPSLAATQQPQQQLAEEAGQLQGLRHFALPSPALWVAGREDSQAAAQTVQLLIDKAQTDLLLWGSEEEITSQACALLCVLAGKRTRAMLVQSPAFPSLLTTYRVAAASDGPFRPCLPEILSTCPLAPALEHAAGVIAQAVGQSAAAHSAAASEEAVRIAQVAYLGSLVQVPDPVLLQLTQALGTAAAVAGGKRERMHAFAELCRPLKLRLDALLSLPLFQGDAPPPTGESDDLQTAGRALCTTLAMARGLARVSDERTSRLALAFLSYLFPTLAGLIRHLRTALPSLALAALRLLLDLGETSLLRLRAEELRVFVGASVDLIQAFLESASQDPAAFGAGPGVAEGARAATGGAAMLSPSSKLSVDSPATYVEDEEEEGGERSPEAERLACLVTLLSLLKLVGSRQSLDLNDGDSSSGGSGSSGHGAESEGADPFFSYFTLNTAAYAAPTSAETGRLDPAKLALDAVLAGLTLVAPLLTNELLQNERLCQLFFANLGMLITAKPAKLTEVSPSMFALLMDSLVWGIACPFTVASRDALAAADALATCHLSFVAELVLTAKGFRPKGTQAMVMRMVAAYRQEHGLASSEDSADLWLAAMPYGPAARALFRRIMHMALFEPSDARSLLDAAGALHSLVLAVCAEDVLRLLFGSGLDPYNRELVDSDGVPLVLASYCALTDEVLLRWQQEGGGAGAGVTSPGAAGLTEEAMALRRECVVALVADVDVVSDVLRDGSADSRKGNLALFRRNLTALVTRIRSLGRTK